MVDYLLDANVRTVVRGYAEKFPGVPFSGFRPIGETHAIVSEDQYNDILTQFNDQYADRYGSDDVDAFYDLCD